LNSGFSLFSILLLLCAGQGLFLAYALIFSKNNNRLANRYLGFFTLLIAITVADASLFNIDGGEPILALRSVLWPRDYLYGPMLYFYVREMTLPRSFSSNSWQWLHFLPAMIHAVLFWSLPFINGPIYRAIITLEADSAMPCLGLVETLLNVEISTAILHLTIYLWMSVRLLINHERRIKSTFSYLDQINLQWLRRLVIGVFLIYMIWVFVELFGEILNLEESLDVVLNGSIILLVYTMSYFGLRQPDIWILQAGVSNRTEMGSGQQPTTEKYKTSSLSHETSQALLEDLQQLMQRDRPYLDSQLSLPGLAQQLDVSVNQLSQIINEQLQQNFFDFINKYRIAEAKDQLQAVEQRHRNILTIATDVGFNSKTAFYTAFKKHAGMTPGEYRKQTGSHPSN
jgi:AraC-like DNA-binding protein